MLTRSTDSASTSADAKNKQTHKADAADQPRHAATQTAAIFEPKGDWVPLASAPFRYNSRGYIRSAEKWGENLGMKVKHLVSSISSQDEVPIQEYSFRSKNWDVRIEAKGITTGFNAIWASAFIHCGDWRRLVVGDPDEILSSKVWKEFPPQQKSAAQWHRSLLKTLFSSLRRDFGEALNAGAAHVMARKNTVLAPFERVAWDQWQYFKLDDPEPTAPTWELQYIEGARPAPSPLRWSDPRDCGWGPKHYTPSTATGPNGEKLYAIHVAPGVDRGESDEPSPEDKCFQWLVESMMVSPERAPKPRAALFDEAQTMFPGLIKSGFGRCFSSAQKHTGNFKWSLPGAPKKSSG